MANYATHIAAGTVVSGALATLTLAANVISHESLVAVTLAGVTGSVLPDIDLKDSRASRILWSGIGVFVSFCVLFAFATKFSIAELWILWLGTLVFARYGLHAIFHSISIHRGVWHSLLAAVFCAVVTAITFKYLLGFHEGIAWLAAGFLFVGYIVHLALDEIYSVDFMGRRLKTSFGTALKFVDGRYPYRSTAMALATVAAIAVSPPTNAFVEGISSRDLWVDLRQRLLPEDKWFGILETSTPIDTATQKTSHEITTGSIGEPGTQPRSPDKTEGAIFK